MNPESFDQMRIIKRQNIPQIFDWISQKVSLFQKRSFTLTKQFNRSGGRFCRVWSSRSNFISEFLLILMNSRFWAVHRLIPGFQSHDFRERWIVNQLEWQDKPVYTVIVRTITVQTDFSQDKPDTSGRNLIISI
jgi:hypothetical protein